MNKYDDDLHFLQPHQHGLFLSPPCLVLVLLGSWKRMDARARAWQSKCFVDFNTACSAAAASWVMMDRQEWKEVMDHDVESAEVENDGF